VVGIKGMTDDTELFFQTAEIGREVHLPDDDPKGTLD